jgi:hypothetical protein
MAANATNIPGAAAPDAEIKGNTQIARIRHAAPIPKQTTPKAIFSTKPGVILGPRVSLRSPLGGVNGRSVSQFAVVSQTLAVFPFRFWGKADIKRPRVRVPSACSTIPNAYFVTVVTREWRAWA